MDSFGRTNEHPFIQFWHCLWLDFRRSLISYPFLFSVAIFLAWMLLNCTENLMERIYAYSLADYISIACVGVDNFSLLILSIATFPYAWSYCMDKQHGFLVHIQLRIGTAPYAIARAICTAVTPFLAVQCALGIFCWILLSMGVSLSPEISSGVGPYTSLAVDGHFILFYLVRSSLTGLTCAMSSEFGLMVTAFFSSSYYALVAPMFGYYCMDILQTFSYQILHIDYGAFWINKIFFGRAFQSYTTSYLWALGWMMIVTILCGWFFCRRVYKEFQT